MGCFLLMTLTCSLPMMAHCRLRGSLCLMQSPAPLRGRLHHQLTCFPMRRRPNQRPNLPLPFVATHSGLTGLPYVTDSMGSPLSGLTVAPWSEPSLSPRGKPMTIATF
jgi:hypothetical protein